jgi:hypothetical protein
VSNLSPALASKAIFSRPAELYSPFDDDERERLSRLVRQVDRLRSYSFFAHPPHRMSATFVGGVAVDVRADAPPDEAMSAVAMLFRELYDDHSATSAVQILKLLSKHVHSRASDLQAEAVADLRAIRRAIAHRCRVDPRGVILEELADGSCVARSPATVIDLWLNGEYYHFDRAKAAELAPDHPLTEAMRVTLLSAIWDLANLWAHTRNAAFSVLREPALIGINPQHP